MRTKMSYNEIQSKAKLVDIFIKNSPADSIVLVLT